MNFHHEIQRCIEAKSPTQSYTILWQGDIGDGHDAQMTIQYFGGYAVPRYYRTGVTVLWGIADDYGVTTDESFTDSDPYAAVQKMKDWFAAWLRQKATTMSNLADQLSG